MKLNIKISQSLKSNKLKQFKPYAHFTPARYSRHLNKFKKSDLDCFSIKLEYKGVNLIGESSRQNNLLYSKSQVIKTQPSRDEQCNSKSLPKIISPKKLMRKSNYIIERNKRSREIIHAIQNQKAKQEKRQKQKLKVFQQLQQQRRNFQKQFERLEVQYIKQQYLPTKKFPLKIGIKQFGEQFQMYKRSQQESFRQNTSNISNLNDFLIKEKIRKLSINEKEIVITLDRNKQYSKFYNDKSGRYEDI